MTNRWLPFSKLTLGVGIYYNCKKEDYIVDPDNEGITIKMDENCDQHYFVREMIVQ